VTVIIVESGEYEEHCVLAVASTREAAIGAVKEIFKSPPYIVEWIETRDGLTGHFEYVQHCSTKHTARFDFTEYEVAE
jgi:hypothetical protein